jgi:ElaB/YqjD/DUF883 family membrane-anchored ribosome-binding protein
MAKTISLGFLKADIESQLAEAEKLLDLSATLDEIKQEHDEERRKALIEALRQTLVNSATSIARNAKATSAQASEVVRVATAS